MAQASKTFRIFVSSTFSDLKEERNAIQKQVFPKLRELCMKHGCRFQAIDLRWGVFRLRNFEFRHELDRRGRHPRLFFLTCLKDDDARRPELIHKEIQAR